MPPPLPRATGGFNPQFMPSLAGICTLFSRWLTAASLWVHLLAVNLFAARELYMEGEGGLQQASWLPAPIGRSFVPAGTGRCTPAGTGRCTEGLLGPSSGIMTPLPDTLAVLCLG